MCVAPLITGCLGVRLSAHAMNINEQDGFHPESRAE